MRSAHVATINAHGEWSIRRRQLPPVSWAAIDKTAAFLAQGIFCTLGHTQEVIAECNWIEFLVHWECVFQQFRRDAL
jgi:hypothetical protein